MTWCQFCRPGESKNIPAIFAEKVAEASLLSKCLGITRYKRAFSFLTSACGEVVLGLEREEGEGDGDGGADAGRDHDGVGLERGGHSAQQETLAGWKEMQGLNFDSRLMSTHLQHYRMVWNTVG